ncbi:pro-sigmaK processing inhibitor BofA family protein [Syntrophomonas erecta]
MEIVNVIMAALFLLVILYIVAQVLMKPIKLLWKVLLNSAVGLILLLIVNYIGNYFDFSLPINIITILIAGFLGIPGILLLVCFQLLVM